MEDLTMKDIDLINRMIEESEKAAVDDELDDETLDDDDEFVDCEDFFEDGVSYRTKVRPGWKLAFDMFEDATWPDDGTEKYVAEQLGGGDIRYTQITVFSEKDAEIMDPAFELGVKIEDGKCVGVAPFLYEKQTVFSNVVIDYKDKDKLNRKWNEFVDKILLRV